MSKLAAQPVVGSILWVAALKSDTGQALFKNYGTIDGNKGSSSLQRKKIIKLSVHAPLSHDRLILITNSYSSRGRIQGDFTREWRNCGFIYVRGD
ncbi:hypothetical protein Zmor_013266 [Zophobas morio]|uniref:Uncharacterized protein n=1 Tax=Zophobas morio TaxID=2755281 RepID=A0AA38MF11_9CUCU|nr:hypothetical protein Zmor_013266 [Zophobas morio]